MSSFLGLTVFTHARGNRSCLLALRVLTETQGYLASYGRGMAELRLPYSAWH